MCLWIPADYHYIFSKKKEIQIAKADNGFWQGKNNRKGNKSNILFFRITGKKSNLSNLSILFLDDLDNYDEFTHEILDITRSCVFEDVKANTESEVSVR